MRIYEKSKVFWFGGLFWFFVVVLFYFFPVWHLQDLVLIFFKIEAFSKPSFQVTHKGTKRGKPPSALGVHLSSCVQNVRNH